MLETIHSVLEGLWIILKSRGKIRIPDKQDNVGHPYRIPAERVLPSIPSRLLGSEYFTSKIRNNLVEASLGILEFDEGISEINLDSNEWFFADVGIYAPIPIILWNDTEFIYAIDPLGKRCACFSLLNETPEVFMQFPIDKERACKLLFKFEFLTTYRQKNVIEFLKQEIYRQQLLSSESMPY
jgi:hypothetical protein